MLPAPIVHAAREMPLFSGLSEAEKDALIQGGQLRSLARGQRLFSHGETVSHFYLVVAGTLQQLRTAPDGSEKTIAIITSGQTLCEDEIMDACHGHRATAVAVEDTRLLEFPVAWLKNAAQHHSGFALNLLSLIAQRAHMAELEAEHQAKLSAAQLVACFLQRLCVLHNFDPAGFELPYRKTLIASRLGIELETFSRTLAKLKEHGIVVSGDHVAITDLGRIGEYVCAFCSISGECATHQSLEKQMDRLGKS